MKIDLDHVCPRAPDVEEALTPYFHRQQECTEQVVDWAKYVPLDGVVAEHKAQSGGAHDDLPVRRGSDRGNMDFEDFTGAVGNDGIFRGSPGAEQNPSRPDIGSHVNTAYRLLS